MKKTILITGAGARLGAAIAQTVSKSHEYDLILHYHTSEKEIKKMAKITGVKKIIQADLSTAAGIKKLTQSAGQVDILINTIGNFIYKPLLVMKSEEFTDCIENNLFIAWNLTRAFVPKMIKKGFGRIINFGSVGCDQITARPLTTPYYIAKTGLVMMTKSLARELMGQNVTVNLVTPGVLPTGVKPHESIPVIPFDAVAKAVLFLVQAENGHINGANLEVSAGWRPE